jgi:aspartyl-tRNA(Asn)/glutamyl-tRNA(Gln) amidotransferase subunit B
MDLLNENSTTLPISVEHFKRIIEMVSDNKISSRSAKDLLILSVSDDRDPEAIAGENAMLLSASSVDLTLLVRQIIDANPAVASDYKAGKEAALEYLVGQSMKSLKGAGNPSILRSMLKESMK